MNLSSRLYNMSKITDKLSEKMKGCCSAAVQRGDNMEVPIHHFLSWSEGIWGYVNLFSICSCLLLFYKSFDIWQNCTNFIFDYTNCIVILYMQQF